MPPLGYVVEGELLLKYDDGTEKKVTSGDVFYMPAGHTGVVEKDLKMIDFSPTKELEEVMNHIAKKVAELN
jgi:quercetin dioxygenase-like cupin family protein